MKRLIFTSLLTLVLLVALPLTLVLCLTAQTWLWVPVMILVAGIAFVKLMPQPVMNWLVWTGGISAAMFVAHPTLRKILIPISHRGDLYAGLLLYVIATIFLSWLFMKLIHKIPSPKL